MRRLDENQIDPEIAASLDAIDATLAGDPVDPRHADLAELALLVAGERPRIDPAAARSLDERVSRRFERERGTSRAGAGAGVGAAPARGRGSRGWLAAGGLATALVGVLAVVVVLSSGPGSSSSVSSGPRVLTAPSSAAGHSAASSAGVASASSSASGRAASSSAPGRAASSPASGRGASSPASGAVARAGAAQAAIPPTASSGQSAAAANLQPAPNGRKVIQSAQLNLFAAPTRIDDVAQEVFGVVGAQSGIVERSNVTQTGGSDGYAFFQLSVPSVSLEQTMAKLSGLHYSRVSSRTDTTQDVNNQYGAVTHQLADARALRTALLKQLANATTTQQVDSLQAQIHDAEASISSDQATLRTLDHQTSFSEVSVTINAAAVVPVASRGGGFTIGKGAHDAGRVLTVAAGVALIVLAALVPVALLVALGGWVVSALRRRRREQALDHA
jgi:hypothetical protein